MMSKKNYYCNPMNLSYKFQSFDWRGKKPIHREAADPSVVFYRDKYWLFASMSGGFWHSTDLINWRFKSTPMLPETDYAPDIRIIDDEFYFCASRKIKACAIYKTNNPLSGKWHEVSRPFAFWDPHLYQDDDGKTYFYWGCSNKTPIYGVEMDRKTMLPKTEKVPLIHSNITEHGWERKIDDGSTNKTITDKLFGLILGDAPFIEGAWMTKNQDKYYLQYAAPGTQLNTYADGVYESESPLGPFTYSAHNPFSLKPGGYITGAGHGSTFSDKYGNLWHISTMRISVNHKFERRIGLFPAGIDKDGILYCNTNFADYPTCIPLEKWDPWKDYFAGWMLLSYGKRVTVSSTLEGTSPKNAVDEDVRSIWSAKKTGNHEWIQIDLGEVSTVNAVQLNFAEINCFPNKNKNSTEPAALSMKRALLAPSNTYQYILQGSVDGVEWYPLVDNSENLKDLPHNFVVLEEEQHLRYLRLTNYQMPFNGNFAMSGFRVFGKGNGAMPETIEDFEAKRVDPLTANISWKSIEGATGYNVRWGIAPDKLYSSWILYDQTDLRLPSLTSGTTYWVTVDAFNENGIREGKIKKITS